MHKQKRVRIGNGKRISVDEGIADIIKGLNRNGCETIMSCQDNFDKVWIEFQLSGARRVQNLCRTHPDVDSSDFLWLTNLEWQYREMVQGDWVAFRMSKKDLPKFRKILKTIGILKE